MTAQPVSSTSHLGINHNFRHLPLNRNAPSIRLIHVLSMLSDRGLIQCKISHATIGGAGEAYICLSYRWGDTSASRQILINDKLFVVRENLYDFLHAVYTTASREHREMLGPYWIDALSIDQTDTAERNHQVAQMGNIFSSAAEVILWLGSIPPSLSPLVSIINNASASSYDDLGAIISNRKILNEHIIDNEYWGRAWVTQEVLLARKVVVWLGFNTIDFNSMINGLKYFYLVYPGKAQTPNHFSQFVNDWITGSQTDKLISLVARFRNKECQHHHDRIYSLLSLCSISDRKIEVDYGISRIQLAVQVLRQFPKSLCLCSAIIVAHALGLHYLRPDSEELSQGDNNACLEFDVESDAFDPQNPVATRWELFCFQRPDEFFRRNYCQYLEFQDICESSSLDKFRLIWEEDRNLQRRSVVWSDATDPDSTRLELGRQYGPRVTTRSTDYRITTVSIPIWLLAHFAPEPTELCRHAKTSRIRRRNYDTRYPHIVPHRDVSDLPPLDVNIPLPEHLARLSFRNKEPPPIWGRRPM